jgi:class 3 adenylate cyclase
MIPSESERQATHMPDGLDNPPPQALERKLATILSADVAEFSRLMGEDEEQTLRIFRGHKEVFESLVAMHRGRIFNTAGDAILAEFSSAVEAVRCGTDIQAALRTRNDQLPPARQVRFRIGINLGDVMLHGQDLLGDGVNVAARLQSVAEPGGICISGSVHDQISNKLSLSFRSLGEMSFKNIQRPVRTFSITEADGHGSLPFSKPPRAGRIPVKWIAAGVLLLAAGGAYWMFMVQKRSAANPPPAITPARSTATQLQTKTAEATRPPVPRGDTPGNADASAVQAGRNDGEYSGPICYGETRTEPERCYHAEGAVNGSKIASHWTMGTAKKVNMFLDGRIAKYGDVKITIEMRNATDGSRLATIDLNGTLRGGLINASGSFAKGRPATLSWHKNPATAR